MKVYLFFVLTLASCLLAFNAGAQTIISGGGTATSGGCTTTYPVTICNPGSYQLAKILAPTSLTTIISITADNVVLDMNGFGIMGLASACTANTSGTGNTCSSAGTTTGIVVSGNHVTVKNGTVSNMSGTGISSTSNAASVLVLQDLDVHDNHGWGISVSLGLTRVSNVTANQNYSGGIQVSLGQLSNVAAAFNNGGGIATHANSSIDTATSINNTGIGIYATGGTISKGVSGSNGSDGFQLFGVVLRDSIATYNGGSGVNTYSGPSTNVISYNNSSYGFKFEDAFACYSNITSSSNNTLGPISGGTAFDGTTPTCGF